MSPRLSNVKPRRRVLLVMYWWEDRILAGVSRYAAENNWELDCRMRWTRSTDGLEEWRGDGVIANVGVTRTSPLRLLVRTMAQTGIPVISTQQLGAEKYRGRVIVLHEEVGRLAAEHLLSIGFTDLAFVFFNENQLERRRAKGFASAVAAGGGTFRALKYHTLAEALKSVPRPMGLMAMNDLNAVGVMRVCLDAGYSVPEEFAVIGVDDTELLCPFAPVPLSSVNCNFEKQGWAVAAMLDKVMDGEEPPASPEIIPPKGVTVRSSTDTLAIPDLAAARALRMIRGRFHEAIRIADVTGAVGRPVRSLQETFRRHVGRTMHEELTRLRVERAKTVLLNDATLKLDAVAAECGFANRFHFSRAFLRLTGCSPREYRARRNNFAP